MDSTKTTDNEILCLPETEQLKLLQNRNAERGLVEILADSTHVDVVCEVINHPFVKLHTLTRIASTVKNTRIGCVLAMKFLFPDELFVEHYGYNMEAVIAGLFRDRKYPPEIYKDILKENNPDATYFMAISKNVGGEILTETISRLTKITNFINVINRNPNLTSKHIALMWEKTVNVGTFYTPDGEEWVDPTVNAVKEMLVAHLSISESLLIKIAETENSKLKVKAAKKLRERFSDEWKTVLVDLLTPDYPEVNITMPLEWLEQLWDMEHKR